MRELPEVIRLRDARGERPENAVGIGVFWYEPEVWALPISPAARVLYAGICSYLGHGEINYRDLRSALKESTDARISEALEELRRHNLLELTSGAEIPTYEVRSVRAFEG